MKNRDPDIYLKDILESMEKIERYIKEVSYEEFDANTEKTDAVIRNIITIGEAAKSIPEKTKTENPQIPWKKMIGLRNITTHSYHGVDNTIIWRIITKDLPETKTKIRDMLEKKST